MLKLHRKGQSLVEFGIVLPIFIGLMVFILGLTVYCYNLIALSTMSRDVARELVVTCSNTAAIDTAIPTIVNRYNASTATKPILYVWDKQVHYSSVDSASGKPSLTIVMKAENGLDLNVGLPASISMGTTMYWENYSTN